MNGVGIPTQSDIDAISNKVSKTTQTTTTTQATTPELSTTVDTTDTQTVENKNNALGIIGRGALMTVPSIAKGLTHAVDKITDTPAYIKNAYYNSVTKNGTSSEYMKALANEAKSKYQEKESTHVLGDKVQDWEESVDERQQAIATDNPNSKLAEVAYKGTELAESIGAMLPSIAVAAATQGIGNLATGRAAATVAKATLDGGAAAVAALPAETVAAAKAVGTATKIASLTPMWMNVYSASTDDAQAQGYTYEQATRKAFADATLEVATEMMFAGIAGIGNKVSQGYVSKTLNKAAKDLTNADIATTLSAARGLKEAGVKIAQAAAKFAEFADNAGPLGEALEEMTSEALSPFLERWTTGNKDVDNATLGEILEAGLGGAIISVAMSGFSRLADAAIGETETSIGARNIAHSKAGTINLLEQGIFNFNIVSEQQIRALEKSTGIDLRSEDGTIDFADLDGTIYQQEIINAINTLKESVGTQEDIKACYDSVAATLARYADDKVVATAASLYENKIRTEAVDANEEVIAAKTAKEQAEKAYSDAKDAYFADSTNEGLKAAVEQADKIRLEKTADYTKTVEIATSNFDKNFKLNQDIEKYGQAAYDSFTAYERMQDIKKKRSLTEEQKAQIAKETTDFVNDVNSKIDASKLKGKLKIVAEAGGGDNPYAHTDSNGTITINLDKIYSIEAAKFYLSHELLHYLSEPYLSMEDKQKFYSHLKKAANNIGWGYQEWYTRLREYSPFYTKIWQEQVSNLEVKNKRRFTLEERKAYYDKRAEEEALARFISTALSYRDILAALNVEAPDIVGRLEEGLKSSVVSGMANTQWDFARLQALKTIKEAKAAPIAAEDNAEAIKSDVAKAMAGLDEKYNLYDGEYSQTDSAYNRNSLYEAANTAVFEHDYTALLNELESSDLSQYTKERIIESVFGQVPDNRIAEEYNNVIKALGVTNLDSAKKVSDNAKLLLRYFVRSAGFNKGYTTRLYHGTPDFGFYSVSTKYSDDKRSFFATSSGQVASTYSGKTNTNPTELMEVQFPVPSGEDLYNEHQLSPVDGRLHDTLDETIREISKKLLVSPNLLIRTALKADHSSYYKESYYDMIRNFIDTEDAKELSSLALTSKRFADIILSSMDRLYSNPDSYDYVEEPGIHEISFGLDYMRPILSGEDKSDPFSLRDFLRYAFDTAIDTLSKKEAAIKSAKELISKTLIPAIDDYEKTWETIIHNSLSPFQRLDFSSRGPIDYEHELKYSVAGNYELLANTDGLVTISVQGDNNRSNAWNNLSEENAEGLSDLIDGVIDKKHKSTFIDSSDLAKNRTDRKYTTRNIAGMAEVNGYSGVITTNIWDQGDRASIANIRQTAPTDEYIFFNPIKQVKSADPMAFDNSGELIPLDERFDENKNDLRYMADLGSKQDVEYDKKSGWLTIKNLGYIINDRDHMFSKIERALNRMNKEQLRSSLGDKGVSLLKYLRKSGINQEELKYSGLLDFLKNYESNLSYPERRKAFINLTVDDLKKVIEANSVILDEKIIASDDVYYDVYKLPGSSNYREFLFVDPRSNYNPEHWTDEGVLVHARVSDFIDSKTGEKVLFVEEIQSDLHNAGLKYGYKGELIPGDSPERREEASKDFAKFNTLIRNRNSAEEKFSKRVVRSGTLDKPFDLFVDLLRAADAMHSNIATFAEKYSDSDTEKKFYEAKLKRARFELETVLEPRFKTIQKTLQYERILNTFTERLYLVLGRTERETSAIQDDIELALSDGNLLSADDIAYIRSKRATGLAIGDEIQELYKLLQKEPRRLKLFEKIEFYSNPDNFTAENAPYKNGKYVDYVFRQMLRHAVEGDYGYVAWTTPEMQIERWSDEFAKAYKIEYGQEIPSFAKAEGAQYGAELQNIVMVPINPRAYDTTEYRDFTDEAFDKLEKVITEEYGDTYYFDKTSLGYEDFLVIRNKCMPSINNAAIVYSKFTTDDVYHFESSNDPDLVDFIKGVAIEQGLSEPTVKKFEASYTVPAINVTSEMQSEILTKGQPRFMANLGGATEAVEDDTIFKEENFKSKESFSLYQKLKEEFGATAEGVLNRLNPANAVSGFVSNFLRYKDAEGNGLAVGDLMASVINSVLDGAYSHFVVTDDSSIKNAKDALDKFKTWSEAWKEYTDKTKGGKGDLSKTDIVQGEMLLVGMCDQLRKTLAGENLAGESTDPTQLYDQIEKLIAELCAVATKAGQNLQAFSLLKKLTPQGRLYYIQSQTDAFISDLINKKGESRVGGYKYEIDPKTGHYRINEDGNLVPLTVSEEYVTEMLQCKTQKEMQDVEDKIIKDLAEKIPPTLSDRILAWRYFAMLGNPRTHIRNFVSNVAMGVAVQLKDQIAGAIEDYALSDRGPEGRTKSFKAYNSAARQQYIDFANEDFETSGSAEFALHGGKLSFQSRIEERRNKLGKVKGFSFFDWLDGVAQKNSDWLDKEDRWAAKKAYARAFANYCLANNLSIEFLTDGHVENNTRLAQARSYAVTEAAKATYHDANDLATMLNNLKRKNPVWGFVLGGIVPFTKTPFNILKRGIEYSPFGIITGIKDWYEAKLMPDSVEVHEEAKVAAKEAVAELKKANPDATKDDVKAAAGKAMRKKTAEMTSEKGVYEDANFALTNADALDLRTANERYSSSAQKTLALANAIDELAAGMTGTAIMALGMFLANLGLLKASGSDDDREEYYDQMTGNQEYSITLFGKNYTLDWLTPASMMLFTGAQLMEIFDGEGFTFNEILSVLENVADPVMNLSVLQGVNDAISGYDAGLGSAIVAAGENYVGQFIPTLFGQVARSIDPTRRTTYTAKEGESALGKELGTFTNKLENKVPGLSFTNSAYVDQWGRQEVDEDPFLIRLIKNSVVPWYERKINKTETDDYISKLYDATGDSSVIPNTPSTRYTFGDKTYYLLSDEYQSTKEYVGQLSYQGVNSLLSTTGFSDLSDEEQAEMITNLYSLVRKLAKADYAASKGIQYTEDAATARMRAAMESGMSIGQVVYLNYLTGNMSADKDDSGKTISGSKKAKVEAFYKSMGLSTEQMNAISSYDFD